jgi:4-carboxymuconolactone decarboxylase
VTARTTRRRTPRRQPRARTPHHDLSDASYHDAASGERGIVALVGLVGYFTMLSMILRVAHTPPDTADVPLLPPSPG